MEQDTQMILYMFFSTLIILSQIKILPTFYFIPITTFNQSTLYNHLWRDTLVISQLNYYSSFF